jgi:hypothetical protein
MYVFPLLERVSRKSFMLTVNHTMMMAAKQDEIFWRIQFLLGKA